MKILLSTFGENDLEKVVQAMKNLPYERLVLLGRPEAIESKAFDNIRRLEEMAGHDVVEEELRVDGFMDIVDEISDALVRHAKDDRGMKNDIVLNISGGDKLMGDAALFAAFRLGIEAYHCDEKVTKLPVLKGLTAKDRFTPSQVKFIRGIGGQQVTFDVLVNSISPGNRLPVERVMRELRKAGLISTNVKSGKIIVALSESGAEVARAVRAT